MILLKSPYPNHTTSKGAKAKIGMACDMTRKGVIAASTLGKLNMTIARGIDMARPVSYTHLFFAEEGLKINITSPSESADALKLVAAGRAELGISYEPQALVAASEGVPVLVIGRLIGHPLSTVLYLSLIHIYGKFW